MTSVGPHGRYRLEDVVGVGSFSTVHRALDTLLDAPVGVKILAENHSLNPEVRERFIAEGRSLRRVRSPYVVTVHDIGESDRQQPYQVLELADRGTLAQRVEQLRARGWAPSRPELLTVARQLAAALAAVHSARLVHRDLSPANVLLTSEPAAVGTTPHGDVLVRQDERLLVADLGMCKDLALNSGLTVAGGTSGFRPPELASGPAVIDERADIYSLSALLDWLRAGSPAASALDAVVRRGSATAPERRHPDAAAWLAEVEQALLEEPAASASTTASTPEPSARRGLPSRAWLVGTALAVAAAVCLGWLLPSASSPGASTSTARIAVEGPGELEVGTPATLTLTHEGVRGWVWELPTGDYVTGRDSVDLTPTGPGSAVVTVRATDARGRPLVVEHRVRVTDG